MKKIRRMPLCVLLFCVCLVLCLTLSTCFNPLEGSGESTISISIGSGSDARAAITPVDLIHEVIFSGPDGREIIEYINYGEKISVEAVPGLWNIDITAYLPDDRATPLATGYAHNVEKIHGQTKNVTITMDWVDGLIFTVTFSSNGGSNVAHQRVLKNNPIDPPAEPVRAYTPTAAGLYRGAFPLMYEFDGWNDENDVPFNFSSPINGNTTLTAQWEEPDVDLTNVTGPDLHSKALTHVYGNPGTYTLLLDENISLAPQSLTSANTRLTLSSLGGPHTVSLTGTGSLFTINANTELALADITLQGVTGNTAPLVTVNTGGKLAINNGGTITGNTTSGIGGGVYNGGVFEMTGSALVTSESEVYLVDGTTITVTGTLTNSRAAKISLPDYSLNASGSGRQVLSGNAAFSERTKFALSSPVEMWVANDGTLSGYIVSNLAGNGTAAFANGTGIAARFNGPCYLALDSAGVIYVTDSYNYRIRKITPNGVVTSLAGSGTKGFANGTGTAARFDNPRGLAIDSAGNIYVGDSGNNRIRRITSSGAVTTFAGSGTQGFQDGTATAARFNSPYGLALDNAGNVYVADFNNHRIRKITSNGAVSTLAGSTQGYIDGTSTAARFSFPRGLVVDSAGNLYVVESENYRVRKITPDGVVTTLAGDGTAGYMDGPGASARFIYPYGIAVDSAGNVYVGDSGNNRIRKISPNGEVTTLAGDGTAGYMDGPGASARFSFPRGLVVDSTGNIYVADEAGNRIRKLTPGPR